MPTFKNFVCPVCNKKFIRQIGYVNQKIKRGYTVFYCSKKCLNISAKTGKEIKCENCGKIIYKILSQITNHNFCSHSCAASFNNKGKIKNPKKERICKKCKKKFFKEYSNSSILLCPDCCYKTREYYKSLTLEKYYKSPSIKNKHPSWRNSFIRNFNRTWNKELLKYPCQICGYNKHVELCHKKAITSFSLNSILGEINSPNNNLVLCRRCHWEVDHKLILLEDIPDRKQGTVRLELTC